MNATWQGWAARIPDPAWSRPYRAAWTVVATLTGVGAALAVATTMRPLTAVEIAAGCAGTLVPSAAAWALACERPWHAWIRAALVASVLITCFAALSPLVGGWSLVLPVLVLTSPRLVSVTLARLRGEDPLPGRPSLHELRHRRAWRHVSAADAVPPALPAAVDRMSMHGLCRLWSETSRELATAVCPSRHLEIVALREACLDAMAVQDPDGCARWLSRGRVDSDPAAYLL